MMGQFDEIELSKAMKCGTDLVIYVGAAGSSSTIM
jgi:hypothetical protein